MIKVGDKFIGIDTKEEVVASIWESTNSVVTEKGTTYSFKEVYRSLYEQQKQQLHEANLTIKDLDNLFLGEKQRVDELEREKNEAILALFNQKDYYGKLVSEEKQRADLLEKRWNELKGRIIKYFHKNSPIGKQYDRSILCLMDELEGKENVFETLQQLEEDGE